MIDNVILRPNYRVFAIIFLAGFYILNSCSSFKKELLEKGGGRFSY